MADAQSPDWNEIQAEDRRTRSEPAPTGEPEDAGRDADELVGRIDPEQDISEEEAQRRRHIRRLREIGAAGIDPGEALSEDDREILQRHMQEHRRRQELEHFRRREQRDHLVRTAQEVRDLAQDERVVDHDMGTGLGQPMAPPPPVPQGGFVAPGGEVLTQPIFEEVREDPLVTTWDGATTGNIRVATDPMYSVSSTNQIQVDEEQIKRCMREVIQELMEGSGDFMLWLKMKYTALEVVKPKKKRKKRRNVAARAVADAVDNAIGEAVVDEVSDNVQYTLGVDVSTGDVSTTVTGSSE